MIRLQHKNIVLMILVFLFCCSFINFNKNIVSIPNQELWTVDEIAVHNFNQLEPFLHTTKENIHLVNFWAMWCVPCVKELPHILEFSRNNPTAEILLVSMDFPEEIETKLKPFLIKNEINLKVVILDDPDANTWINKVDPNWSGAIPFTIIFNNENRVFYEGAFESATDIENLVHKSIK